MMSRRGLVLAIVLFTAVPTSHAPGQEIRSHIPVRTRLVQLYSDYERQLAEAISNRNTAEIDRLVAKDFELRSARNIGVPVPRADWVAQLLKEPSTLMALDQMAVHDYGDVRVVSFLMRRAKAVRHEAGIAVVDVWLQNGDESVLKTRYASVQTSRHLRVPGETVPQQIDKRY